MDNIKITKQTKIDIDRSIANLENKKTDAANEKIKYQNELSELNFQVRGNGRKIIPQVKYDTICQKQAEVKRKMLVVDQYISELKKEITNKRILRDEVDLTLNPNTNPDNILGNIISLRDKYVNFASDNTRVSSTRLMASRFAEDLDSIIKSVK